MQKRVAAIHDISCFGKCSLTVALPILSAAGIETSVIPTAVLSTHTGGFTGFTFRDLTEDIFAVSSHWKSLPIGFDTIYTGFLGSLKQIDIVSKVFEQLRSEDTLIVVDPVMADNGELYSIFPENFPRSMRALCAEADIIVPNMTEAALLLNEPYIEGPYTKAYIEHLLRSLSDIGPKWVVLTGVCFDEKLLGAAVYIRDEDIAQYALCERIEGSYHGTGDVFASALVACVMRGVPLVDAADIAADFTAQSISRTQKAGTDVRFGVNFEESLPHFLRRLGLSES